VNPSFHGALIEYGGMRKTSEMKKTHTIAIASIQR
jgi:hypothetical protein